MQRIYSVVWIGSGHTLAASEIDRLANLDVTWVRDADEAGGLRPQDYDAAIVEGAADGVDQIERLRRRPGFPPVLACLPESAATRVRSLLTAGAGDVLVSPDEPDDRARATLRGELLDRLVRIAASTSDPQRGEAAAPAGIVGDSPAMREVFALVGRAAATSATVLVTGETGTGKELVARAIHEGGARRTHRFVAVNCAAFPDTLLESELFGHEKGSFTGADRDKAGLFEVAHLGTLFLDEIGETSGPLQAKLLRVLQEREIRPVGGTRARPVDSRVVVATNRDLRGEAGSGFFREDLYYRLAVFPIYVPPLRKRREDVLPLARHFLQRHGERDGKRACRLSRAAEHLLLAHAWPGNVRELENEMQRALALADSGETITPAHLSDRLASVAAPADEVARPGESLRDTLARVEALLVRRALERNEGRRAVTAQELGLTREGLFKKMKRLGIE